MDVYPLVFEPILKPKIWGGRKLEELLHKRLPPGERIGESWEVADLEDHHSVVAAGPARGKTLGELVQAWGPALCGEAPVFEGRFPLLIKYLDATETLSVQVHPDEATARRRGGRVRIKNEAWYVIDTEPDGFIYRGVNEGVDAAALRRAIEQGCVESVLRRIDARKGRCYYLPSGTIHALGAGVTVAEVQTPSDVTYRLYDWNRIDSATGRPRELHLEQALECVSYDTGPIEGEQAQHVADVWTTVTTLVRGESFAIDRVRMSEGVEREIPADGLVVWMILEGRASIACDGSAEPVALDVGNTVVLPAGLKNGRVSTHEDCMWLEATIPVRRVRSNLGPSTQAYREQTGPW